MGPTSNQLTQSLEETPGQPRGDSNVPPSLRECGRWARDDMCQNGPHHSSDGRQGREGREEQNLKRLLKLWFLHDGYELWSLSERTKGLEERPQEMEESREKWQHENSFYCGLCWD